MATPASLARRAAASAAVIVVEPGGDAAPMYGHKLNGIVQGSAGVPWWVWLVAALAAPLMGGPGGWAFATCRGACSAARSAAEGGCDMAEGAKGRKGELPRSEAVNQKQRHGHETD